MFPSPAIDGSVFIGQAYVSSYDGLTAFLSVPRSLNKGLFPESQNKSQFG